MKKKEPAVFVVTSEKTCAECGETLLSGEMFCPTGGEVLCLVCADLDHLVFLPSGNTALTRRSRKHSSVSYPVLKWSKSRKRHERQGVLVSPAALEQAEEACLADADVRERRREREAHRREVRDSEYVQAFATRIRDLYPGCPPGREIEIAAHACEKYSGRVGRTAAAKDLDSASVRLAVAAHVRHAETDYDRLLADGYPRDLARDMIREKVDRILDAWG